MKGNDLSMTKELAFGELFEQDLIIEKINELYITNRQKFLRLNNEGNYSSQSYVPLHDGLIEKHLDGIATFGVFSGKEISKFVCFDIDMTDKKYLKWVYYLLMESLSEIGIPDQYIHAAHSGNKGLHVLLFVEGGTPLKHFKQLFIEVMRLIQSKIDHSTFTRLRDGSELVLDIGSGKNEIGHIEFRPTENQGVKLELGINYKNPDSKTNKCWFVDKDTLIPIKRNNYILEILPIPKDEFIIVIDQLNDTYAKEIDSNVRLIKENIKEPHSHKINKDENETIQFIVDLLNNGMTMSGTRHNSILKIAKYFRYIGLELEECIVELKNWMSDQDSKYYTSTLEYALSECERVSRIVYEREYSLVGHVDNLKIYKSELEQMIKVKNKNDKLILFSMMLHSKRYALDNGVFYMTYKQIHEMCNVGRKGSLASIVRLESSSVLEVVSRNIRQDNGFKHKPNKYKLNLKTIEDELALEINNDIVSIDMNHLYLHTITKVFTNEQLSHLPTRQYKEISKYRNTTAS